MSVYHLVFHDCPYEMLLRYHDNAQALRDRHEDDTNHDVEYAQL